MPDRRTVAFINYPTDHLLGVLDDPSKAASVRNAVHAAGIPPAHMQVLVGQDGAAQLDGLGERHGLLSRLLRLVQFTTMDQMPDFAHYEAALRDGRAVIAVRARDRPLRARVRSVLREHGVHFTNFYGRFATETMDPWVGPELPVSSWLRE